MTINFNETAVFIIINLTIFLLTIHMMPFYCAILVLVYGEPVLVSVTESNKINLSTTHRNALATLTYDYLLTFDWHYYRSPYLLSCEEVSIQPVKSKNIHVGVKCIISFRELQFGVIVQ